MGGAGSPGSLCMLSQVLLSTLEGSFGSPSLVLEDAGVPDLFLVSLARAWDPCDQLSAFPVGIAGCNWGGGGELPLYPGARWPCLSPCLLCAAASGGLDALIVV